MDRQRCYLRQALDRGTEPSQKPHEEEITQMEPAGQEGTCHLSLWAGEGHHLSNPRHWEHPQCHSASDPQCQANHPTPTPPAPEPVSSSHSL